MIKGSRWQDCLLRKTSWLGCCISVERRTFQVSAPGPESCANDLMRIGLASNEIRPGAFRSAASGEAGYRKIEASPKEMYRAIFADEACAKFFEDGVAQN